MKKEIKDLILDKRYNLLDKIIAIYKMADEDNDIKPLSKILDLPEIMLTEFELKADPVQKSPVKSIISQYIELFSDYHLKIHGRRFDFDPKEIGQLQLCIKKFETLTKWEHILILIEQANYKISSGSACRPSWKYIVDTMKPSTIYNQRNFILNEESRINNLLKNKPKEKKKWGWKNDEEGSHAKGSKI